MQKAAEDITSTAAFSHYLLFPKTKLFTLKKTTYLNEYSIL